MAAFGFELRSNWLQTQALLTPTYIASLLINLSQHVLACFLGSSPTCPIIIKGVWHPVLLHKSLDLGSGMEEQRCSKGSQMSKYHLLKFSNIQRHCIALRTAKVTLSLSLIPTYFTNNPFFYSQIFVSSNSWIKLDSIK